MNEIYYHIGLHKTGTTFLQREYFPHLHVRYLSGGTRFGHILNELGTTKGKILFSDENFSGSLFGGNKSAEFANTMLAIKNLHADAKIIVGFRRHRDFVLSAYKQHLQEGGSLGQSEFYAKNGSGILRNEDIEFTKIIDLAKEYFDDIFIYTIEDLNNLRRFHLYFSKFMGLEESIIASDDPKIRNRSVSSSLQVKLLLGLNSTNNRLKKALGIDVFYSKLFKFLRITPRNICQHYIRASGTEYRLDDDIGRYLDDEFAEDWRYVLDHKSVLD